MPNCASIYELAEIKRQLEYQIARNSYIDYVELVHHGKWQRARHLELICDELEKVVSGETKRLMFLLPPRHGKSMSVTKSFPSYFLGKNPDKNVIEVSYGEDLAKEFGEANRDKVSEFGKALFGIEISDTQSSKVHWKIKGHDGGMLSVGIGGSITGKGADLIILDDPIKNSSEAKSEAFRSMLYAEWQSSVYTRLHAGGAIIIILTRWHEADLVAKLLKPDDGEPENWRVISLPCVCDSANDLLGRKIGETLWPERGYDEAWAARTKKTVGSYAWAALYQQKPTPEGGAIFKREWMNQRYKRLPENATIIQSWDLPFLKSEASAKCAGIVMARHGANIYFVDVINDKMEFTETVTALENLSAKHPLARAKVIEDKANGPAIINYLRNKVPGLIPFQPIGSKEDRARSVTPYFESGNVFFPEGAYWVNDLIEDLVSFPNGEFKDTIDATAQGILYLESLLGQNGGLIYREFVQDSEKYISSKKDIYERLTSKPHKIIVAARTSEKPHSTSFVAVAVSMDASSIFTLTDKRVREVIEPHALSEEILSFVKQVRDEYASSETVATSVYCEDDSHVGYDHVKSVLAEYDASIRLYSAYSDVSEQERIETVSLLLNVGVLRICEDSQNLIRAMLEAQYDTSKAGSKRLENGVFDTATLLAFEDAILSDSEKVLRVARLRA